jgi:hypothetical protein
MSASARVNAIVKNIQSVQGGLRRPGAAKLPSNAPKGLPTPVENSDDTNPDFAIQHQMPSDPGYISKNMITGSGNGPEFSRGGSYGI